MKVVVEMMEVLLLHKFSTLLIYTLRHPSLVTVIKIGKLWWLCDRSFIYITIYTEVFTLLFYITQHYVPFGIVT